MFLLKLNTSPIRLHRNSSVGVATGWTTWVRFPAVQEPRPALEPIQLPIQRVPEALFSGIKRQGRETDHSPRYEYIAEFKKDGAIPRLPRMSSWHSASLIKYRDEYQTAWCHNPDDHNTRSLCIWSYDEYCSTFCFSWACLSFALLVHCLSHSVHGSMESGQGAGNIRDCEMPPQVTPDYELCAPYTALRFMPVRTRNRTDWRAIRALGLWGSRSGQM
jgi:hypothetical protein